MVYLQETSSPEEPVKDAPVEFLAISSDVEQCFYELVNVRDPIRKETTT